MKQKGFTLIELLVVVAIIGILAAVGVLAYSGYTASSKKKAAIANFQLVSKFATHETAKCTKLGLETSFNDYFGCNALNGSRITTTRKIHLVAHSTCVALGGLTYRSFSQSGSISNPYAPDEPACGRDSNFHGRFDMRGGRFYARSDSYIETKSVHVTSNSDRSMFVVNKCPSYGKDNLLGMVVFTAGGSTGANTCPVISKKNALFGDVGVASCIASPCTDPNNILYRTFSFD